MFKKIRNNFARLIIILGGLFSAFIFIMIFLATYISNDVEINRLLNQSLNFPSLAPAPTNESTEIILIYVDLNDRPIYTVDPETNEIHVKFVAASSSNYDWYESMADKIAFKRKGIVKYQNKRYIFDSLPYSTLPENEKCIKYALYDYTSHYNNTIILGSSLTGSFLVTLVLLIIFGIRLANRMVEPIEETFVKQKELITNASHELKTPLAVINTNLEVLDLNKTDSISKQQRWFDNIKEQTVKLNNLVCQMLDLARTDSLIATETKTNLNVSEIIQRHLLIFESSAFEKNIIVTSDIQDNIYYETNKENIEKVFTILFENAIKYCNTNGKIRVILNQTKKEIQFSISNTGKGIKKENLDKIFQRFYKEDESYKEGNNNSFGLGLSIAKSIIDNYKGNIKVESIENKLTTFKVSLIKK